MTTSPESTRPATRRELRERAHTHAARADRGPLPAFGDGLRPPAPGIIADVPRAAVDTETAVQHPDPHVPGWLRETMSVDAVEPDREPDFLSVLEDEEAAAGAPAIPAASAASVAPAASALSDAGDEAPADPADPQDDDDDTRVIDAIPPAPDGHNAWADDGGYDGDDEPVGQDDGDDDPMGHDEDAALAALLAAEPATRENLIIRDSAPVVPAPERAWADESRPPTALTWLDPWTVRPESIPEPRTTNDLFAGARLVPGWLRPRVLIPIGIVAAFCGTYVATTLLWPLNAVAPTAETVKVEIAAAPAATATWPGQGSAAVGVQGFVPLASTSDRAQIASISKVASVLMVLDKLPLQPGEQGPSFEFTRRDANDYWRYRNSDQSALDIPVGGSLTEYQMLQGIMLGSANNYIDRLAREIWGSEWAFSQASEKWLADRGLGDITLESPSGFDKDNVASPASLLKLGELAMKNPVFAEIVATRSAEIPGAGTVTNTNKMLDDPGVVGIKTGTLGDNWNLLTAKDVPVGDTTVHLFASVLGQDGDESRLAATRQLFADVEKSLAEQPVAVPRGTVVGKVTTEWGDRVDVVTDADAHVVLWNGAGATASTDLELGEKSEVGAKVGTLLAEGPLGSAETSVSLADEITKPSIWWRLTHPLELFGLDKN